MAHPLEKIDKENGIKANYDKIPGLNDLISGHQLTSESVQAVTEQLQQAEVDMQIPEASQLPSSNVPPPIDLEDRKNEEPVVSTLSVETVSVDEAGLNKKIEEKNKDKIKTPVPNYQPQNTNDPDKKKNIDELNKDADGR